MKRTQRAALFAAAFLSATAAFAVGPGGTLFIRARNTRLLKGTNAKAKVLAVMQPGERVTWNGADPKAKQWHQVTYQGKSGYVFQSALSTTPPRNELGGGVASNSMDTQAFVSSGAATKALSEGALRYGEKKKLSEATAQFLTLEALAKSVTPEQVAARSKKSGVFSAANEGGKR